MLRCWIVMPCLWKFGRWMSVMVYWHTKMKWRYGVPKIESLQWAKNVSFCYDRNMVSSSVGVFSLEILIPIFSGHVLDTISITYSFCCHSEKAWCRRGKTNIHSLHCWWKRTSSSLCMLEQRCHVCQFLLWHCTKSMW